jgi:hypothetical protein
LLDAEVRELGTKQQSTNAEEASSTRGEPTTNFKQELETHLAPGKAPVSTRRLVINTASFDTNTAETKSATSVRDGLTGAQAAEISTETGTFVLEDLEVDNDAQVVTGTDVASGATQTISFRDIDGVTSLTAEQADQAKAAQDIQKVPKGQQENFMLNEAEVGQKYTTPDGTVLETTSRTEDRVEIKKNGVPMAFEKVDGEWQNVEELEEIITDLYDNVPSDFDLYNALSIQNAGRSLTLKDRLMLRIYRQRANMLSGRVQKHRRNINQTLADYVGPIMMDLLDKYTSVGGRVLFARLSMAYEKAVLGKNRPENLDALMKLAGISESDTAAVRDLMGYFNYAAIWSYVTQADRLYGTNQSRRVREFITQDGPIIRREANRLDALDENNTPEEKVAEVRKKVADRVRAAMLRQGIIFDPENKLESMPKESARAIMLELRVFFEEAEGATVPEAVQALFEVQQYMVDMGMTFELTDHVELGMSRGIGRDILVNNGQNFMQEFKDVEMSELNKDQEEMRVKTDRGGEVRIKASELDNLNDEQVVLDHQAVNDLLEGTGAEITLEYVAAYHKVNGNIDQMFSRLHSNKKLIKLALLQVPVQSEKPVVESFINKKKAQQYIDKNQCK